MSALLDPLDAVAFKSTMGHFCTGVVAITSDAGGEPIGMTCQSFASVSLDPPMVLICPARTSTTFPRIRATGRFAVSVLHETHAGSARQLARSGATKFTGIDYTRGPAGLPILAGALAWAECRIAAEHDGGDHTIVLGAVEHMGHELDGRPLTFYRGRFGGFIEREQGDD